MSLSKIALALNLSPYVGETEILKAITMLKLKEDRLQSSPLKQHPSVRPGTSVILSKQESPAKLSDWDYLHRKNPEFLEKLKKTSFAEYASLFKAKFGVYPKKEV